MLTKAKLAEYNQRGELVPIGTKLITVQLGECEIYAHNKGRGNNYIYECYNSQRRMSYDKEFKLTIDSANTSLIDPTPSSVNSPFTREELEQIQMDFKHILIFELDRGYGQTRRAVLDKANHLLSAPSEWPQMMLEQKLMQVSHDGHNWHRRIVIAQKQDKFIAWVNAQSFDELSAYIGTDTWEHARPIQKEKTLSDLKEGDKVYAVGQYVMTSGSRKGLNILDFGKLHDVTSVNGNSFAIRTIEAEFHWFHSDRDKHIFSCYPPTPEQIATAEAAEIQAVKDKYEGLRKEVTQ